MKQAVQVPKSLVYDIVVIFFYSYTRYSDFMMFLIALTFDILI